MSSGLESFSRLTALTGLEQQEVQQHKDAKGKKAGQTLWRKALFMISGLLGSPVNSALDGDKFWHTSGWIAGMHASKGASRSRSEHCAVSLENDLFLVLGNALP